MYKENLAVEMFKVMRGTFTDRHYAKFSVYCYHSSFAVYKYMFVLYTLLLK